MATKRQGKWPCRMPLAIAAEQTLATLRSTTLGNSSKTTSGLASAARPKLLPINSASRQTLTGNARAKSQRKRSPLLNTWYGFTHDGGEPKPTAVNSSTTWRTESLPKQSTTARSVGQSELVYTLSLNARRAIVLLPLPDGPTIRPI